MDTHKAFEGYSAKNPVPKVEPKVFLQSLIDPSAATEQKAKKLRGHDEKEVKDQNATEKSTKSMVKGKEVRVQDLVTGEETTVRHGGNVDEDADTSNKGENILSLEYPPPNWRAHREFVLSLTRAALWKIIFAYISWPASLFLLSNVPYITPARSFSAAYPTIGRLIFLVLAIIPPSLFAYTCLFAIEKQSEEDFEDHVWDAERARGVAAGQDVDGDGQVGVDERIKESAEWLNNLLAGIWPIMNPDLFSSSIDMLEDIMQASSPKFVHSVRVADLGQGKNAARITSIRSLPDAGVDEDLQGLDESVREHLTRDHVNVEVSFAYKALPSGSTASSKAHNAHLLIEFFLGVSGTYEFNLPVWVELTGVTGTARARLELIPDPPFIKTTLVSLMGLPKVSLKVVPMSRALPNVMNIPVLSTFISESIDTACAEYVAPKSLTLDLQQLISGDDIKKDTMAIGVVIIHIHRARGIKKMDTTQSSDSDAADPYVTVVYQRQGKPLYSTRIIFEDLNPCFEETAAVLVDANAIKIREKLCLQLWDSDRASADDMMGFVEIDILELMRHKNEPTRHMAPISSPDSEERPGFLEYTIGFYSKIDPNKKLSTDGSDPSIPEDLKKSDPEFQEARAVALNDLEAAVLVTPPDPQWPSGILSVQIHEVRDLRVRTEGRETKVISQRKSEGSKGQDDDGEEQEEGSDLPSSYCTIAINDNLVYSTRVKPITSTPIFNAGTERFIRDWRSTHISVTIRDSRMREKDPILGVIFLKLSDLLKNASEVTRFWPIENGIGYGSARVSVLFRPVQATLPPQLLGFDFGTLHLRSIEVKPIKDAEHLISELQSCEVKLKASSSSEKLSKKDNEQTGHDAVMWSPGNSAELPIQNRYSSALVIRFKEKGVIKSKNLGMSVLWLRDIIDSRDSKVQVALFQAKNYKHLKQNYVPPDGNLDQWDEDRSELTRIGDVELDLKYEPGITPAHRKSIDTSKPSNKRMWEEVDRRDEAGLQDTIGQREGDVAAPGENTEVSAEQTQDDTSTESAGTRVGSNVSASDSSNTKGESDDHSDEDDESKGLMDRLREWKRHEKELHKQHRGIMQTKPARTAEWLKDNLEEAEEKVKNRFKMQSRQPDIETEV